MYRKKIYKTYFSLPAVFIYTLLFMVPVVLNFYYSFTNWNAIKMTGETAKFIGFDNYIKIFQNPYDVCRNLETGGLQYGYLPGRSSVDRQRIL